MTIKHYYIEKGVGDPLILLHGNGENLLSDLDGISYRAMMGEFLLYYQGRVFGGIYDDRFLVKPVKSAVSKLPDADREPPYDGAKEMLLVDTEDRAFLKELIESMYPELAAPKRKN